MKTSWSRIEVLMLTEVSPLLNFDSSLLAGEVPSRSQMASVRRGCELPENIFTFLMMISYHSRTSRRASFRKMHIIYHRCEGALGATAT